MGSECTRSGGYFERQVKGQNLCAVHAVNNLFDKHMYSPDEAYERVLRGTMSMRGLTQSRAEKDLGAPVKVGYDAGAVAILSGGRPIPALPSKPPSVGLLILLSMGQRSHWVCARRTSEKSYEYVDSRHGCRLLSVQELAQFFKGLREQNYSVALIAVDSVPLVARRKAAVANRAGGASAQVHARAGGASAASTAMGARPTSKASGGKERTPGPPWWDIGYPSGPFPRSIEHTWHLTSQELTDAEEDAAIADAAADDIPAEKVFRAGTHLRRRRAPRTNSARARNYASRLLTGARARSLRALNGGCGCARSSRALNGGCGCARSSRALNGGCGCARASRSITGGTPAVQRTGRAVRRTKSAVQRTKGAVQRPKGTVQRPKGTVQRTKSSGRRTSGTSRKSARPRGRK
jgi:hypothetical protein